MSHNPYHQKGRPPTLRKSVLAYVDILGYADMVKDSYANCTQQETLRNLHEILTVNRRGLENRYISPELLKFSKKDFHALKAFTDNIAIGWPIFGDGETEMGSAFIILIDFQIRMTLSGFFVRGAMAVGEVYVDDIAVFGDAFTDAYKGESRDARDPRIILTQPAVDHVRSYLTYFGDPAESAHAQCVLADSDGQWFINYLDYVTWSLEDGDSPDYAVLLGHKAIVEERLVQHRHDPKIWAKYAWVARYHNYFCDMHSQYFDDEYQIDIATIQPTPSLIVTPQ